MRVKLVILAAVTAWVARSALAQASPETQSPGFTGSLLLPAPEMREQWSQSLRFERQTNYTAAIKALSPLQKHYAVELRLGWLHYLLGNLTESTRHYQAAVDAVPEALEARLGQLLPLLAQARYAEVEKLARQLQATAAANYYVNLRLAIALRQQGKLDEAAILLVRALTFYPSDAPLLTELGLVRMGKNQLAAAGAIFLDVLTLDPGNAVATSLLADPRFLPAATARPQTGTARTVTAAPASPKRKLRFDAVAYGGYLAYENSSTKDDAELFGATAYLACGPEHLVEGGLGFIDITRRDASHLRQLDATLAYANFSLPNVTLRTGAHYAASDDADTDGGWMVFGGADYHVPYRWNAGLDASYSHYADYTPRLEVWQLVPHTGAYLWRGANFTVRTDLKGYWIHLSHPAGLDRGNFFSLEDRLSLYWGRWTFAAFGWVGQQAFALRADGYALFNLPELHRAGYGGEARYAFAGRAALTVRASREEFQDIGTGTDSAAHAILGMIGISF